MKLSDYMEEAKIRLIDMADVLGVPVSTLHGWVCGRRNPTLAMAVKIQTMTGGRVRCEDLLSGEEAEEPATAQGA